MAQHEIYLAGGCFWGTEAFLRKLPGIVATTVGYANSVVESPSYEQVCSGETHAAECVRVLFDDARISLALLLDAYLATIDPLSHNRQGGDVGEQYRTGIYWTDATMAAPVTERLEALSTQLGEKVAIEASALHNFYAAEPYHQDYLTANPGGYCHVDLGLSARFIKEHAAEFDAVAAGAAERC